MKKILFVLMMTFCATAIANAGDFSTMNFIGFSRDGRYLAYEEYGVIDPGGEGYSSIVFIDVLKNSIVGKPISLTEADEHDSLADEFHLLAAQRHTRALAAIMMRKLRIVPGNTGREMIARPLSDITVENASFSEPKTVLFAPNRRERWLNGRYQLTLKAVPIEQFCAPADDPEMVRITDPFDNEIPLAVNPNRKGSNKDKQRLYGIELLLRDDDQDKTIILQKDQKVPLLRGCSIDYRIGSVFVYRDRIVAFIGVIKPGWGGDNIRTMAVTGRYQDHDDEESYDAP